MFLLIRLWDGKLNLKKNIFIMYVFLLCIFGEWVVLGIMYFLNVYVIIVECIFNKWCIYICNMI